jgi:hypothetical protein
VTGANNFIGNYAQILPRNNYTVKLDHSFTERDKINVRYLYNSDNRDYTSAFPIPAADTVSRSLSHQNFVYFAYTRVISSTVINEARFTYGWRIGHSMSPGLGEPWPSRLGLKGVPDEAFPTFTVAGLQTLGANSQERNQDPVKQIQWVDNLSITRGRHAFKLGAEARLSLNYEVNRPSISGQYTFTTQPTGLPGASGTGVGFASLLLGFPNQATFLDTQPLDRSGWYLAGFFQDDWTVNQSLTLNLGVRWETDTPNLDAGNRMNSFDRTAINPVSGTPGVVRFAGVDGWPKSPFSTNWKNFGPRVGFAWRPLGSKQTVIRGGGGIFFAHPYDHGQPNAASLGFEKSFTLVTPDNGLTAPFYLRDGVPTVDRGPLDARFGAVPVGQRATTAVTFYEPRRGPGYALQFNLGVQRELPGGWLIEASYLGNLSRKLASQNLSINQITPAKLAEIAARPAGQRVATQADRPFPQFSDVTLVLPTLGISNYHAGVLGVEKRFSRGFSLNATYTWSKFLNNTDDGGSAVGETGVSAIYSNYYDRGADYGPSSNDIPHRFTLSSVYELPFGRGHRLLSHHWAGRLLGNWSLSVVSLLQTGAPLTVTTNTNTSNSFAAGPQRANVTGNPALPDDQRTLSRWFDTNAFTQPAAFTFGSSGRGLVRGDGVINFDLSILKNFAVSEQKQVQFRAELFNAFNHPNFLLPGTVLGRPGFGVVSTANPGRSIQLGLRLTF